MHFGGLVCVRVFFLFSFTTIFFFEKLSLLQAHTYTDTSRKKNNWYINTPIHHKYIAFFVRVCTLNTHTYSVQFPLIFFHSRSLALSLVFLLSHLNNSWHVSSIGMMIEWKSITYEQMNVVDGRNHMSSVLLRHSDTNLAQLFFLNLFWSFCNFLDKYCVTSGLKYDVDLLVDGTLWSKKLKFKQRSKKKMKPYIEKNHSAHVHNHFFWWF